MADVAKSGLRGDVFELAATQVVKQVIAVAHRGDVEIGFAVIVDIDERRGYADLLAETDTGLFGDVLKPAAPSTSATAIPLPWS